MNMKLQDLQGRSFDEIADALGWSAEERVHARSQMAAGEEYDHEAVIQTTGGREIRFPLHPRDCDYVRVCQAGFEIAYQRAVELREDPEYLLASLLKAAQHGEEPGESLDLCSDLKAREGLRSSLLNRRSQEV